MKDMSQMFCEKEGTYQLCVDFRKYNEDDKEIYQYDINRKYSTEKIELHDNEIINMSYLVTAMVDTEEQVTDMEQYLMKFYDSKKIQIMPGAGRAKEIFLVPVHWDCEILAQCKMLTVI